MSAAPSIFNSSTADLHQGAPGCRRYRTDATILLVGFIGAGKKTLGFIASAALRRRFIDFEAFFRTKVQTSPQEFTAAHGFVRYREVEIELCQELLTKHRNGCVIAGLGVTASLARPGVLGAFSQHHPVVYVRRDKADLQNFLGGDPDRFNRIFEVGNTFFESISNLDFFNITQEPTHQAESKVHASLKLKEIERVFVAFLYRIFGQAPKQLFSADAFSEAHTYSLHVPLDYLEGNNLDLETLDAGADAISVLLSYKDYAHPGVVDRLSRHMVTLRKHTRVPIIVDASADAHKPAEIYWRFLEIALRVAPDAITAWPGSLEVNRRINSTKGHCNIIALHHQPSPLEGENYASLIPFIRASFEGMDFEALRLTGGHSIAEDTLSCLVFRQKVTNALNIPVIAYNDCPEGRASIILNPTLSPISLCSNGGSKLSMREAQRALSSLSLRRNKCFTIVGQDVRLSLSPAMHNRAYHSCGLPHTYAYRQIQDFCEIEDIFREPSFGGLLNGITISLPFKTDVLRLLDEVSPDAKDINAVNTVVLEYRIESNGAKTPFYHGYNTDYIGIKDCIYSHLSPANAVRDVTTALIIGAGGMARAAVYSCYQLGVRHMFVYNRTPSNAQKLARYYNEWARSKGDDSFHLDVINSIDDPWPSDFRLPTIVVSCIPGRHVGTQSPVELLISEKWLESRTGGVYVEVSRCSTLEHKSQTKI
jgi:shikimate 5-dehydrogenase/shikimate kinase